MDQMMNEVFLPFCKEMTSTCSRARIWSWKIKNMREEDFGVWGTMVEVTYGQLDERMKPGCAQTKTFLCWSVSV